MTRTGISAQHNQLSVVAFQSRLGIDFIQDAACYGWSPQYNAEASSHVETPGGGYNFWQVDYVDRNDAVRVSRMIAELLPGDSTEFAYWRGAGNITRPYQSLTVHKGLGMLVLADPEQGSTTWAELDARQQPHDVRLPDGTFYAIRNGRDSRDTLVVSSVYPPDANWQEMEQPIELGQKGATDRDGRAVAVPPAFQALVAASHL